MRRLGRRTRAGVGSSPALHGGRDENRRCWEQSVKAPVAFEGTVSNIRVMQVEPGCEDLQNVLEVKNISHKVKGREWSGRDRMKEAVGGAHLLER